jgi:hypothetical protein
MFFNRKFNEKTFRNVKLIKNVAKMFFKENLLKKNVSQHF